MFFFKNNELSDYKFFNNFYKQNENLANFNYEMVCNKIANESLKRLSADNVTVMIVNISDASKNSQI
jgi:hypothetical protein